MRRHPRSKSSIPHDSYRVVVEHFVGDDDVARVAAALNRYLAAKAANERLSSMGAEFDGMGVGFAVFERGNELWLQRRERSVTRQGFDFTLEDILQAIPKEGQPPSV